MTVVFYVSGHGFGHAARQIEVINALHALLPDVRIQVRTSAAAWLFQRTLRGPAALEPLDGDPAVVQRDGLHLDIDATIARATAFYARLEHQAAAEAAWLTSVGARLVLADIPPLAFASAARAGVPACGLANFTWDWIYAGYEELDPRAAALSVEVGRLYSTAEEAWRLPMHGGFETFPAVRDLPFVARRSRRDPMETRAALALPADRPLALMSFGGYGVAGLDPQRVTLDGVHLLVVTSAGRPARAATSHPVTTRLGAGLVHVDELALAAAGFRYEDLINAVDVVVTKPGYGILADCIANDTAVLYTSRGRFREYDVLVAQMPRWVRCRFLPLEAALSGDWGEGLRELSRQARPRVRPAVDGAEVAARLAAERLTA